MQLTIVRKLTLGLAALFLDIKLYLSEINIRKVEKEYLVMVRARCQLWVLLYRDILKSKISNLNRIGR